METKLKNVLQFLKDIEVSINEFYNLEITESRCTIMGYADYSLINRITENMGVKPKLNCNNHIEFVNKYETMRIILTLK